MSLKIRLRREGRKNRDFFRLVLTDSRSPRDGKYLELLGWYDPLVANETLNFKVDEERLNHWLSHGAILTEKVTALLKRGAPQILKTLREKDLSARAKLCAKRKENRKKKQLAD